MDRASQSFGTNVLRKLVRVGASEKTPNYEAFPRYTWKSERMKNGVLERSNRGILPRAASFSTCCYNRPPC